MLVHQRVNATIRQNQAIHVFRSDDQPRNGSKHVLALGSPLPKVDFRHDECGSNMYQPAQCIWEFPQIHGSLIWRYLWIDLDESGPTGLNDVLQALFKLSTILCTWCEGVVSGKGLTQGLAWLAARPSFNLDWMRHTQLMRIAVRSREASSGALRWQPVPLSDGRPERREPMSNSMMILSVNISGTSCRHLSVSMCRLSTLEGHI